MKNPSRNALEAKKTARDWFANLLWVAFPSRSEAELAKRASAVLGVTEKQVRNWLRCDHDASVSAVCAVMAIAGAEVLIRGRAA